MKNINEMILSDKEHVDFLQNMLDIVKREQPDTDKTLEDMISIVFGVAKKFGDTMFMLDVLATPIFSPWKVEQKTIKGDSEYIVGFTWRGKNYRYKAGYYFYTYAEKIYKVNKAPLGAFYEITEYDELINILSDKPHNLPEFYDGI